ncbi:flagellar type III secretion system pore protein FliP [Paracoccus pacificus]|uniref:Flagellar biosynthetic protein FliP n=1 Tax=Paracoccus pacificus TaxID=1463598 RepID=A0ABW4RBV4_9RHOB
MKPLRVALLFLTLLPGAALAQDIGDLGQALGQGANGVGQNAVLLVVMLTALSLAPAIAIMVTCFPFIVTVLSILRQSIGLQQSPPNMLIVSLAVFLTWFVMDPVFRDFWEVAGRPLQEGQITLSEAFQRGVVPFRGFMEARADPDTLAALQEIAPTGIQAAPQSTATGADSAASNPPVALSVLVPGFMLSEIQRAFEIGFLVSLPFLIIDLVVSAVLMSMGMMMVPPAVVALPFKLAFFVVVDGWGMIAGALVRSYQ